MSTLTWALALLLLLSAPASAADAAAPSPADGGTDGFSSLDADTEDKDAATAVPLAQQAADLRRILVSLRLVRDGKPPSDGYVEDLFPFNLSDEKAVDAARKDLRDDIAQRKTRAQQFEEQRQSSTPQKAKPHETIQDAGVSDALVDADGDDASSEQPEEIIDEFTVLMLELQVAEARLAFLDLPLDQRKILLEQDAQRKRADLEKERANAEREKALAEQKRAEAARQKALADAERARNEIDRIVANEHARMEGVRGAQAFYRRELAERRELWAARAASLHERLNDLVERSEQVAQASGEANVLYDDIVHELATLRGIVREGLSAYRRVPTTSRYETETAYDAIRGIVSEKDRSAIENNQQQLADSAADLERQARTLAWETLEASVAAERTLNAKRVELLDIVTPEKRSTVLGFGPEGIAQLRRELDRMALEGVWYRTHGEVRLRALKDLSTNPFWIGRVTWTAFLLLIVLGSVVYVRRKGAAVFESLRVVVVRSIRHPGIARPIATLIDAVVAVLSPLAMLLGVLAAQKALGDTATIIELAVPLRLLLWYSTYRLIIVGSHRLLFRAISHENEDASESTNPRSELIARSVRMVARYVFGVAIILIVAAEVVDKGYLYHLVLRFAWIGVFPIAFVLIRRWRKDIADAYLAHRSTGRLAELVRSTRHRWFGFFVAVAAFGVVLGQASARTVRRFVLGFEQTRKALAFLFRRRLEKQAAEVAIATTDEPLPEELEACFSEDPVQDEPFILSDVAGMDTFEKLLTSFSDGNKSTATLVVGETGFGKTSWLNIAKAKAKMPVHRIVLERRILQEQELLAWLVQQLDLETAEPLSVSSIVESIEKRGKQMIQVDDGHLLTLRGVGTSGAWNAFSQIVERSRAHAFWIVAINGFAFQHLAWARKGVDPFREIIHLKPWSEARVAMLLQTRSKASGYEMVYDDLVVDKLEGVEGEAQLVSTQEGYARLIWDYADGCPRVALHCWKDSLVADGPNRVRVRLFRRPHADELESLDDNERFVLASVIWHGSLTTEQAVKSLNLPASVCGDAFGKLQDQGVLGQSHERYFVQTRWLCPVLRFLRRKHLIEE
ncbi:MAG TPA: hypothetical protein PKL73_16090 [Polyangiaceae bacterium]|jgi:hypothetical protein|nr:hypothetical protein [Polyangiaceae bacterium]HNZ24967.1 hypothetical protein [Polyangiaceae bacterium]HOD24075.1 hypothetical protein [Polyangiaceae bacterium]HOE50310.1 hypothetical protein [Polyangiaceae bacterium]HOH02788.1 hypothetical protein [Polyangiaceae bacterium]